MTSAKPQVVGPAPTSFATLVAEAAESAAMAKDSRIEVLERQVSSLTKDRDEQARTIEGLNKTVEDMKKSHEDLASTVRWLQNYVIECNKMQCRVAPAVVQLPATSVVATAPPLPVRQARASRSSSPKSPPVRPQRLSSGTRSGRATPEMPARDTITPGNAGEAVWPLRASPGPASVDAYPTSARSAVPAPAPADRVPERMLGRAPPSPSTSSQRVSSGSPGMRRNAGAHVGSIRTGSQGQRSVTSGALTPELRSRRRVLQA